MIVYITTDGATVAGSQWAKGTRLEAPDRDAQIAVQDGLASFEPLEATPEPATEIESKSEDETQPVTPRRGRPPKQEV